MCSINFFFHFWRAALIAIIISRNYNHRFGNSEINSVLYEMMAGAIVAP